MNAVTKIQIIIFLHFHLLGEEETNQPEGKTAPQNLTSNKRENRGGLNTSKSISKLPRNCDSRICKNGGRSKEMARGDPCPHGEGNRVFLVCAETAMNEQQQRHSGQDFAHV